MVVAAIPINERQRLEDLKSFSILHTPAEQKFDEITKLASLIAKTPIACISIVAESQVWFKSKLGIQMQQIERPTSFCTHVVAERCEVIVNDATLDSRFFSIPLVTLAPHILFYAGFPLVTPGGTVLGSLCVMDTKPNALTEQQSEALLILSHQVMELLISFRDHQESLEVNRDLQLARTQIETQQTELEKSSRLKSLGQLAGGISHEINNPLSIISAKTQILMRMIEKSDVNASNIKKHIEVVQKTCDRMLKITRGLTKFARDGSTDPFELNHMTTLVEEVEALFMQKLAIKEIDYQKEGPADLILECRPIEISQVLLNLIGNAIDALENKENKSIRLEWVKSGNYVEISVTDSGGGIPAKVRQSMMNPFFTTKEVGKGTGLGLSIAKGICETHHGSLSLDPRSDVTRFVIRLPLDHQITDSKQLIV